MRGMVSAERETARAGPSDGGRRIGQRMKTSRTAW